MVPVKLVTASRYRLGERNSFEVVKEDGKKVIRETCSSHTLCQQRSFHEERYLIKDSPVTLFLLKFDSQLVNK